MLKDFFTIAHVDDILMAGSGASILALKEHLAKRFKFKDLGIARRFTGVIINRDRQNRRLFIDQVPYVMEILEDHKMQNCTPSAIPMDPKQTWEIKDSDTMLNDKEIKLYQRTIGQLMYLMLGTRPDICYAVTKLA